MQCLRCGYCCIKYEVIIIADPKKGVKEDNMVAKHTDDKCPHLVGDSPGAYACAIHDESWYKGTPCYSHGQIEVSPDDECRMGRYVLDQANS